MNAKLPSRPSLSISIFSPDIRRLLAWFPKHQRNLPWRQSGKSGWRDPYLTWVSEIMLQQTQVATVIDSFQRWQKRFPDVRALARARESTVLQYWAGLGYYSRARNLHKGAKFLVDKCQGQIPRERKGVLEIPGVGEYTAGAILSLAYGLPEPILDGNLIRIFSRYYGWNFLPLAKSEKVQYWEAARQWALATLQPQIINEGLMELGALVCRKSDPACSECPLRGGCAARKQGRQNALPPPRVRRSAKDLFITAVVPFHAGKVFLTKESDLKLLPGHWMPPARAARQGKPNLRPFLKYGRMPLAENTPQRAGSFTHTIMHYRITTQVWVIDLPAGEGEIPVLPWEGVWRTPLQAEKLCVSAFAKKILARAFALGK